MRVSKELSKYKLHLVRIQEVIWDTGGTAAAGEYTLFHGKRNKNHEVHRGFFVHKIIISTVKMVEFVSDGV
jgi:hypothetical protein